MITTTNLVKRYDGVEALSGVDLQVPKGTVYGLVGPNGAGKTTLLSILAGLRPPTSGAVTIEANPSRIAVLPDAPRFEPWLTGREVVELAKSLTAPKTPAQAVDRVLEQAGMSEAADRRVGGYSRGMLQRLGVAATVVSEPEVMILDEPASALDPTGRRDVLDLVRSVRGEATVIFSSHILGDVQEVSDSLGILDRGRLLFQGTADELLLNHAGPTYRIRLREELESVADRLEAEPWVDSVEAISDRDLRIRVTSLDTAERRLIPVLAGLGARVISIEPESPTLEDVFLEITR
ncbi:MAG: ABC transporter ATP-binding protein [Acidobacteria bacterium]|nr:ABC transporter ATP-binding protein [Acidobacteriota bacterium]